MSIPKRDQLDIPQTNPLANYLVHKEQIDTAIAGVLSKGRYILGQEVGAFEKEFSDYVGVGFGVGVGSGTDALHLALRTCNIGVGDSVVTVSHTVSATIVGIELAGAQPILVDIDPTTFTMDPNHFEDTMKAIDRESTSKTARPKAVIPVHLFGQVADMQAISSIAARYGLIVIEDCAQAHGASRDSRRAGAWGHLAAFSFYPTKNLGGCGDGGMVVTNDTQLAERASLLREYGWKERHISTCPGMGSRLDELQAAVLRVKLSSLDDENGKRIQLAKIYDSLLLGTTLIDSRNRPNQGSVFHQYVLRSRQRDLLRAFLAEHSIGTSIHYPLPIHLQPAYRDRISTRDETLNTSTQVCREIVSLPMFPELDENHAHRVGELIVGWSELHGRDD